MKKFLALLMALCMMVGMLALPASAARTPNVVVEYGTPVSTNTALDAKWDAVTSKLQLVKGWAEGQPAPSIKVMYDETNLYFLFETSITSFLPGVNMVQFLLSDKTVANGQCADLTLNLNDMSFTGGLSAGVTAKRYNEADKTVIEITAPWASVASDLTVAEGAVIYLEIISQLNNDEYYSFSMTADEIWGAYLHCSTGTTNFGTLTLGEITDSDPEPTPDPEPGVDPHTVVYGTPVSTNTALDAKWDAVTSKLQLVKGWAEGQPAPSIKVMYDETNLYFLFETSITSFLPGVNMVQFLLSDKTVANGQCADLTLNLNDMSFTGGLSAGVTAKRYNEADKTVIEITAPWASVASDLTVAEGAVIYLEIISQLNNDEYYSFSMTADEIWGAYLHCSTGTTNFGTLTLGELPASENNPDTSSGLLMGVTVLAMSVVGVALNKKRR